MKASTFDFVTAVSAHDKGRCQYCGHPGQHVVLNREDNADHLRIGQPVLVCEDCFMGIRETYPEVAS